MSASAGKNTANLSKIFFLDVGAWQGGVDGAATTSFALISNHDIVLCSWLRNSKTEQQGRLISDLPYLKVVSDFNPAPAIQDFLSLASQVELDEPSDVNHSHAISVPKGPPSKTVSLSGALGKNANKGRGFVQKWGRCPKPFTSNKELLVLLGDIHLHLYTGARVDRFQYRHEKSCALESLDLELRALLEVAGEVRTGGSVDVTTIQLGDMYEVWETEILLRSAYRSTLAIEYENRHWLDSDSSLGSTRTIIHRIIDSGKVLPHMGFIDGIGRLVPKAEFVVDRDGVDFTSTDDICAAIRSKHPSLFSGWGDGTQPGGRREQIFDIEIRGNHDNLEPNPYWDTVAHKSWQDFALDKKKLLRRQTRKAARERPRHSRLGSDQQIWLEHGHALDWHNNDEDWWLLEHGFHMVHILLLGGGAGHGGTKGVITDLVDTTVEGLYLDFVTTWTAKKTGGGELSIWLGNKVSDKCDFEMRLPELRRADDLAYEVWENESIMLKLVGMGHTHAADLILGDLFMLYEQKGSEYLNYLNSEYYWSKDRREREPDWWSKYGAQPA